MPKQSPHLPRAQPGTEDAKATLRQFAIQEGPNDARGTQMPAMHLANETARADISARGAYRAYRRHADARRATSTHVHSKLLAKALSSHSL